ncbi:MAG: transglycosylase SLT domain-containing protein [Acidobacteria bacterium]|nr:transglycosylase SLT domain-containing protein [Acidobacteriota bacterium]
MRYDLPIPLNGSTLPSGLAALQGRGRLVFRALLLAGILAGLMVLVFLARQNRVVPLLTPGIGEASEGPGVPGPGKPTDPVAAGATPSRLEDLDRERLSNPARYAAERLYLLHVDLLAASGREADAAGICEVCAASDPLFRDHLLRKLAGLYRVLGRRPEERAVLGRLAASAGPGEGDDLAFRLAENLAESGRTEEALTAFQALRQGRGGRRADALLAEARLQVGRKAWEEAFPLLVELTEGERYPRQEAPAALLVAATPEVLERFRASEELLSEIALSLLRHRELAPALKLTEELLQRFPDSARRWEYLFAMARIAAYDGDVDGALARYGQAFAAAPEGKAAGVRVAVARLNLMHGRDAEAAKQYRRLLSEAKAHGTLCDAYTHLSNLERRAGRPGPARELLRQGAAALTRGYRLKLQYRLAILDLRDGNARKALAALHSIRRHLPRQAGPDLPEPDEIDFFEGSARAALKDYRGALDTWLDGCNNAESYYAWRCEDAARDLLRTRPALGSAAVARRMERHAAALKRRRPTDAFRELGRVHVVQGESAAWTAGLADLVPIRARLELLNGLAAPEAPPSVPEGSSDALRRAVVFHRLGLYLPAAGAYAASGEGEFALAFGLEGNRAGRVKDYLVASLQARGGDFRNAHRGGQRLFSQYPAGTPRALFNPGITALCWPEAYPEPVRRHAAENGVDPGLVWSVMRAESRFSPRAHSPASARGLMQVMPDTARGLCARAKRPPPASPEALYDPDFSITLGAFYLGESMREFDDPGAAAASYNAGFAPARYWRGLSAAAGDDFFIPEIHIGETRRYVNRVLAACRLYKAPYPEAAAQP